MQFLKWFPWRYLLRKAAKSHGFVDPIDLLSRIERFAEPSEVKHPLELIKAGLVFHARGVVNARVLQHNLDWVWPYWVSEQFSPNSSSFIPRSFLFTHINLTHRNWTAVGIPSFPHFPIVDPRGLVTPFYDGWSLDFWLIGDKDHLIPSRADDCEQVLLDNNGWLVQTVFSQSDVFLKSTIQVVLAGDRPSCQVKVNGKSANHEWMVIALRPYNPEGVSFIHSISLAKDTVWTIDGKRTIAFDKVPDDYAFSVYQEGDVFNKIVKGEHNKITDIHCDVGLASGAAMFRLRKREETEVQVDIPLLSDEELSNSKKQWSSWSAYEEELPSLKVPNKKWVDLFNTALKTLLLLSPETVYPGPFTYKRFWFRDATFILNTLLCARRFSLVERIIAGFPKLQLSDGFFCSQEGEWDANGEVLWLFERFCLLSGRKLNSECLKSIKRAAQWIVEKCQDTAEHSLCHGLLPAGFSAEHLGPNDYYYWDDYWSVAGLRAAANLLSEPCYESAAEKLLQRINETIEVAASRLGKACIPAAPMRRMDAGAVGSLVASYPIKIVGARDARVLGTAEYLLSNCMVQGAFFQDMIHSGLNPYLTLHLAQVLLRAEDDRYLRLIEKVSTLFSVKFRIKAVVADESSPPDKYAPTGTSALSLSLTESTSNS